MRTDHLLPCIIDPIPSCVIWGGIFTLIDGTQGTPLSMRTWGKYAVGIWCYRASICPMEAIHGRRSVLHNVAAAGMMGYVGVSRGVMGVPFVNPYHLYSFRNPAIIGGAVYGAMGGAMAMLEGKTI